MVGTRQSGSLNLNPECPLHGTSSQWYNGPEQAERSQRLRDLYQQKKTAMTVSELISELQKLPPDMTVVAVYDDLDYDDTFSGSIRVSQETLKRTEDYYYRTGPFVRMVDGKKVELPFVREQVALLTVD